MGRVEPFLPQERPELAVARAGIRPPEDLELVGGRETAARMPGGNLGVRGTGPAARSIGETLRYGAPRFARHPFAPALPRSTGLPTSSGFLFINVLTPPALNTNFRGMKCLSYLGSEGCRRSHHGGLARHNGQSGCQGTSPDRLHRSWSAQS